MFVFVGVFLWVCFCGCFCDCLLVGVFLWVGFCGCIFVGVFLWVCLYGYMFMFICIYFELYLYLYLPGVTDADDECLPGLPGQGPAALVYNCAGDEERHWLVLFLEDQLDGVERRLGVGRVEDCLHL